VANNNCGYGTQRGIFMYGDASDSWVSTRKIWNQHTYHITNINDDGTIPAVEANNWATYNNYRQNVQTQGSALATPDLTASFIRFGTADCPNAVSIIARIGNGGSNVAAAPIPVAFYQGDPNAGGTLLGVVNTTQNLSPGQYQDVTLMLSPPPEVPLTVCVVADDNGTGSGTVNECNESNNQCCMPGLTSCTCVNDLRARPKLTKIQLTWTDTGANHYNVYRGTHAGGPYIPIATTTSRYSTFLDTTVVTGTRYYYVVREAFVTRDEYCQSNEVNAVAMPR
jgi:hypothetical protein